MVILSPCTPPLSFWAKYLSMMLSSSLPYPELAVFAKQENCWAMFLPLMISRENFVIISRVSVASQVIGARNGPTNSMSGRYWECDKCGIGDARDGWTFGVPVISAIQGWGHCNSMDLRVVDRLSDDPCPLLIPQTGQHRLH